MNSKLLDLIYVKDMQKLAEQFKTLKNPRKLWLFDTDKFLSAQITRLYILPKF